MISCKFSGLFFLLIVSDFIWTFANECRPATSILFIRTLSQGRRNLRKIFFFKSDYFRLAKWANCWCQMSSPTRLKDSAISRVAEKPKIATERANLWLILLALQLFEWNVLWKSIKISSRRLLDDSTDFRSPFQLYVVPSSCKLFSMD